MVKHRNFLYGSQSRKIPRNLKSDSILQRDWYQTTEKYDSYIAQYTKIIDKLQITFLFFYLTFRFLLQAINLINHPSSFSHKMIK